MKGPSLVLVALLLAPAIGALAATVGPPAPEPLQLTSADVPAWLVGDTWTLSLVVDFRNGTDWIQGGGNVTLTVSERIEVDAGTAYLYLYNSTTTGDLYARGRITDPNTGTSIPLTIGAGTLSGYLWNERGDLAIVKTNQTFMATGSAEIPLIGTRPITIQGAVTAAMQPPEEDFDFPIVPGDSWRVSTTTSVLGYARITVNLPPPLGDYTIVQPLSMDTPGSMLVSATAAESITVPAGTFEAFGVHSPSVDRWYAPNASNYVKLESHAVMSPTQYVHLWGNLTGYTLTPPAIDVSLTLVPTKVAPGGSFVAIVDTTAPGAMVKLTIPVTNFTAMGATNVSGGLVFNVPAPWSDDSTPANTDIGSHGVLIEVMDGVRTGYGAATISLLPLDLTVYGLTATPNPTGDGLATDLRATVAVTTDVAAAGPVDVTFVSEDVDMNGDGVMDLPIDTYCARGSCIGTATVQPVLPGSPVDANVTWIPSPAAIPMDVIWSAVVDPRNQYRELNELNNIGRSTVRVEGPNLTPSNVTVDDGTTLHVFDDPASLGFVSPVIDVTPGRTVDLIVRVKNAGIVNASRATTLAL